MITTHRMPPIPSFSGQDYFAVIFAVHLLSQGLLVFLPLTFAKPQWSHFEYQALDTFLPPQTIKCFLWETDHCCWQGFTYSWDWRKQELVKDESSSTPPSYSWAASSFSSALRVATSDEGYHAMLLFTSKNTTVRRAIKAIKKNYLEDAIYPEMNGKNYQAADFYVLFWFFFKAITGWTFLLSRVTYSNFCLIKMRD